MKNTTNIKVYSNILFIKCSTKMHINVSPILPCANGYEALEGLNEPPVAFDRGP